jgi:transposase-like protein
VQGDRPAGEGRPRSADWGQLALPVDGATYVKVHQAKRIVSAAVITAVRVNVDGRRKLMGRDIAPPKPASLPQEADTTWPGRRVAGHL